MKILSNVLGQKQILVIDALRLSLEIERAMNSRLWRVLRGIERLDDASYPRPVTVLNAIGLAWQLIDTTYRIRGLADQVRGLQHKLPEYQLFQRNTASTKAFRNFFRHLNSEIPKLPAGTNPIIGVLSWVTKVPSKSRTIVYGTFPTDGNFHSLVVDTWTGRFASQLHFTAGQKDLDIDNIHKEVTRFRTFFSKWLVNNRLLGQSDLRPLVLNFYIQNL